MSDPRDVVRIVRQWTERAEEDLRNAEHTLTMIENCPYTTICFHAQQAAEKYIKALLAYLSVPFPKTHDIGELLELLSPNVVLPLAAVEQESLTRYATVTRYPGDWEPITRDEAEEAVSIARKTREAVIAQLPKEVLE